MRFREKHDPNRLGFQIPIDIRVEVRTDCKSRANNAVLRVWRAMTDKTEHYWAEDILIFVSTFMFKGLT